ncbi:serine/threonine kinase [Aureococcus anophagefferens]|nr:serine/threonine kinase [Aureococcus anophagefferens]
MPRYFARLRLVACLLTAGATTTPLGRLKLIDQWLAGAEGAPKHWRVRGPSDVDDAHVETLSANGQKSVNSSRLADGGAKVVVKSHHNTHEFAFGKRASDIAYFELLYLEYLRGEPGVPTLHGGWTTAHSVVWVTSHDGATIGQGTGYVDHAHHKHSPLLLSPAYAGRARDAPLDLARAWLRCFRSFAERGGFVLTDFKPAQFALDGLGRLTLVDGPAPNTGAVATFARRHFLAGHPSKIHVRAPRTKPDHLDLEPGLPWPCGGHGAASAAHYCAKRTSAYHHCREDCEEVAARRKSACAGDPAACAPFDWRVHVYDLAARSCSSRSSSTSRATATPRTGSRGGAHARGGPGRPADLRRPPRDLEDD